MKFLQVCVFFGIVSTIVFAETQKFSEKPSNLPVKKVFVHGRPVYVRQVFVDPLRDHRANSHKNRTKRNGLPALFPGLFGGTQTFTNPYQPSQPAAAWPGYQSNIPAYAFQQSGSSVPVQSVPNSQFQSGAQQLPVNSFVQNNGLSANLPAVPEPSLAQSVATPIPPRAPAPAPALAPVPAESAPAESAPAEPVSAPIPAPAPPKYPLPECYTVGATSLFTFWDDLFQNTHGFMCCRDQLETLIKEAYEGLKSSRNGKWSTCNIQQIANRVQQVAEKRFNTTFEVTVGVGDYASKSHFYHNYICKVEFDSRFILAYATPRKNRLPQDEYLAGSLDSDYNRAPQKQAQTYGPEEPSSPYRHVYTWRA